MMNLFSLVMAVALSSLTQTYGGDTPKFTAIVPFPHLKSSESPWQKLCEVCPPVYRAGVGECHNGFELHRSGPEDSEWHVTFDTADGSDSICVPLGTGVPDWIGEPIRRILAGVQVIIEYMGELADGTFVLTYEVGFDVSNTGGPYTWEADVVYENGYIGTLTHSTSEGVNAPDHHAWRVRVVDTSNPAAGITHGYRISASVNGQETLVQWKERPPVMRGAARLLGISTVRIGPRDEPIDFHAFVPIGIEE